jgi:hypothetical protein
LAPPSPIVALNLLQSTLTCPRNEGEGLAMPVRRVIERVAVVIAAWAIAGNAVAIRAADVPSKTPARPSSSTGESPKSKSRPASVQNAKLREELLARMAKDQKARMRLLDLMGRLGQAKDEQRQIEFAMAELRAIDGQNLVRMKEIVRQFGWPGRSLVGKDGAQAAWLMVQHADSDVAFQKQCLALIVAAVENGEALPEHEAYLTDRVRVAEKQRQVYGTQFREVNGRQEPFPIENEAEVDQRRQKIGLPSMAEYRKSIEQLYPPGMKDKQTKEGKGGDVRQK